MKSIKKVFIALAIAACPFVFTACQTLENIVVLTAANGNNLFLRNTVVKTKNKKIPFVEFDVTVNADKSTILKNPVVNYTFTISSSAYNEVNSLTFAFENDGNRYAVENAEVLYKEIDKKKNMIARFTSEISAETFEKMVSNYLPVNIVVCMSDGTELVLSSEEIDDKMNDLRIILK